MAEETSGLPFWVVVQQQTFTNWVNHQVYNSKHLVSLSHSEQLKKRDLQIQDITTDFSDGIMLINLLEILSGNSVGKYDKKARITRGTETTAARQAQMVFRQNVDKALTFTVAQGMS